MLADSTALTSVPRRRTSQQGGGYGAGGCSFPCWVQGAKEIQFYKTNEKSQEVFYFVEFSHLSMKINVTDSNFFIFSLFVCLFVCLFVNFAEAHDEWKGFLPVESLCVCKFWSDFPKWSNCLLFRKGNQWIYLFWSYLILSDTVTHIHNIVNT